MSQPIEGMVWVVTLSPANYGAGMLEWSADKNALPMLLKIVADAKADGDVIQTREVELPAPFATTDDISAYLASTVDY